MECKYARECAFFIAHFSLIDCIHYTFQKLSEAQQQVYKSKAKQKPSITKIVPPKYTSQGISLELEEREQQRLFDEHKHMERKTKKIVALAFEENSKQCLLIIDISF